jgi:hypothetical protein
MNKVIVYVVLIIIYLGLSKSFSPSEFGINYVLNEKSLAEMIKGKPVTVILSDMHSSGFIIKTYYHKYKVIHGFQTYEELIVRTSRGFSKKHKNHIGLSIFRRYDDDRDEDFTPLPPGLLFVGDRKFGTWKFADSGDKVWSFYRVYRNLPTYLGWGKFRINETFYKKAQYHITQKKPYYGLNNEFGLNGEVTKKAFKQFFERQVPQKVNFKDFFRDYLRQNFYQNGLLE